MSSSQASGSPSSLYCEQSICLAGSGSEQTPDLLGTVVLPTPPAPRPPLGLVTVHGWGGTRIGPHRLLVRISRQAAENGIPAFRFDLPGRGESGGDSLSVNLDGMIDATRRACAWLQKTHRCQEIALCGICSGGNVALGHASRNEVAGVCLLSTFPFTERETPVERPSSIPRLKEYLRKALSPDTWRRLFRGEINLKAVSQNLAPPPQDEEDRQRKTSSRDILADLSGHPPPLSFVYGSADPEWPRSWSYYEPFVKKHGIPHAIHVIDDANHNFYTARWSRQVEEAVSGFLSGLVPHEDS